MDYRVQRNLGWGPHLRAQCLQKARICRRKRGGQLKRIEMATKVPFISQCGHRTSTFSRPVARRCCCWDVSAVSAVSACPAPALSFTFLFGRDSRPSLVASRPSRFETSSTQFRGPERKNSCSLCCERQNHAPSFFSTWHRCGR